MRKQIHLDCAKNANMAKTCPITTVQDSIDALALSLFEALRGIRDATVASSSSSSLTATKNGADPTSSAYRGEEEEEEEDERRQLVLRQQISSLLENNNASKEDGSATGGDDSCSSGDNIDNEAARLATIRLLHGLNVNYFPPRAYDMNNPDYESFLIAYLSEDKYAKELVEMMMQHSSTIISSNNTTKQDEEVSSSSLSNNTIIKLTSTATATTDGDNDNGNNMMNSSAATTTKKSKSSIKLNVSSKQRQLLPKHIIQRTSTSTSGGGSSNNSNSSSSGGGNVIFPRNHEEYVRLLHSARHDRDECTARRLARNVLSKSRTIDALVSNMPGMERDRSDQLRKIGELISLNHELSHELEEAYTLANARREEVRRTLRENTCLALGIDEEEDEE
jgi:hypothetical protein